MPSKRSSLSRVAVKILEVAGAALASAAIAFLLGGLGKPETTAPIMVKIAPADDELVRFVRSEPPAPEKTKSADVAAAPAPLSVAPAPPAPSTLAPEARKLAKPAPAVLHRREHKVAAAPVASEKSKVDPVPPVQAPTARAEAAPIVAARAPAAADAQPPTAASADASDAFGLIPALKRIPGWFLPSGEGASGEVPRPPVPIGQFWQGGL
jgi:outer membrane biosynthesis protein TonB